MEISRIKNTGADQSKNLPAKSFTPVGAYILVKPVGTETRTKGGIILTESSTDSFKALTNVGRVVSIAKTAFNPEIHGDPWFVEGDFVMWSKFTGFKMLIANDDGEEVEVALIPYEHVIAKVEDLGVLNLNGFKIVE